MEEKKTTKLRKSGPWKNKKRFRKAERIPKIIWDGPVWKTIYLD